MIVFSLALVCSLGTTNAARILGLFPMAAKSHFSCNDAIMKSLHAVGHHVTMVTPFVSEDKIENFTCVNSRFNTFMYVGQTSVDDFTKIPLSSMLEIAFNLDVQYCYDVMNLKEIQEALDSPVQLYDVMFVEIMLAYECYLPIAQKLGIPVIGTVTTHTWKLADNAIGVPHNPAVINTLSVERTVSEMEMSFIERVNSLWTDGLMFYYHKWKFPKLCDKFYGEHFTEDLLYKKNISLIFYNNHASLFPRPVTPNAIEIGGIHLKPANPLPEDFQKFIDEATYGVVLFTLGSMIRASTMSSEKKEAFLKAFATIPQRVIWKFEEPIEDLPKNIMLSSWLPQRDILEHKNVIAFMSHCGQSGVYEALATGTPVITIPIFGDQFQNAAFLFRQKVAVHLDFQTVTKETVTEALNSVINDTSYYLNMQAYSRAFKDRPLSPQQSVVYWTEYVMRHNGAPYLRALGANMPLYKYLMLDILLVALSFVSVVVYLMYLVAGKVCRLSITQKGKYEISTKKEK